MTQLRTFTHLPSLSSHSIISARAVFAPPFFTSTSQPKRSKHILSLPSFSISKHRYQPNRQTLHRSFNQEWTTMAELRSGFLTTLTEQQQAELKLLTEKVKDVPFLQNHPDGDAYLLRFLRATMEKKNSDRIFHTEKWGKHQGAFERIMETVEFYNKWDLSEPPAKYEEFQKLRPHMSWFDTKANRLIVCEKAALFYSHTDPNALTKEEWTACIAYRVETFEQKLREARKEYGLDDRPRIVAVQDVTGLSLGVRKMRPVFAINSRIFGNHHPELLAKAYAVNAPWIFEKIYQIAKTMVDPNTIAKVEILTKTDKLKDVFDVSELPGDYGGNGEMMPIPLAAQGKKSQEITKEKLDKFVAEAKV